MKKNLLSPEQQEVWDKLSHVPEAAVMNNDVASMYPWQHSINRVLSITKTGAKSGELKVIGARSRIGKSRITNGTAKGLGKIK